MHPDDDGRGQDEERGEGHREHAPASSLDAIDDGPKLPQLGEDLLDLSVFVVGVLRRRSHRPILARRTVDVHRRTEAIVGDRVVTLYSSGSPGVEPPMLYARAADLVAVTHAAFIAFLLVGGFVAWRRPRLVWVHVPAVVVTAVVFAFGADCPLTDLEKYLRREAGERAYRDGFIAHYLLPMVPDGARAVVVPVVVVVVTAIAYAGYIVRRHRAGTEPALTPPTASAAGRR
jgi:Protein of Unknown function (DUF2784)